MTFWCVCASMKTTSRVQRMLQLLLKPGVLTRPWPLASIFCSTSGSLLVQSSSPVSVSMQPRRDSGE